MEKDASEFIPMVAWLGLEDVILSENKKDGDNLENIGIRNGFGDGRKLCSVVFR